MQAPLDREHHMEPSGTGEVHAMSSVGSIAPGAVGHSAVDTTAGESDEADEMANRSLERLRSTSATQRRIENLLKLMDELSRQAMNTDEIAWFLQFSPSGARKYIGELRDACVVELAYDGPDRSSFLATGAYRLSTDTGRVAAFRTALAESLRENAGLRTERPGLIARSIAGSGRHLHILHDDIHYAVRIHRGPITRDPLVAALFGPPAGKERAGPR